MPTPLGPHGVSPLEALRQIGDPVLRARAGVVTEFDDRLVQLCAQMERVQRAHDGVGLAAPQIGVSHQVLTWDATTCPEGWTQGGPARGVLINPVVLEVSGRCTLQEGCLSVPRKLLPIERPERIRVRAQTPEGTPVELDVRGFVARIILHEIDHLDGLLITDHVTRA